MCFMKTNIKISSLFFIILTASFFISCRAYSKITAKEMHQPVMLGPIARVGVKTPEKRSVFVQKFKFDVGTVSVTDNITENEEGIEIQTGQGSDISENLRRIYYNETLKIFVDTVRAKPRAICHFIACFPGETTSIIGGIYE